MVGGHDGYAPTRAAASSIAPVYTLASWSTVADQPKADACLHAPAASACSRLGAVTRANAGGSWPSPRTPESPSLTTVRSPPTLAATTGVPQACASRATRPNDSEWEGGSITVAARYHCARLAVREGG